MEKLKSISAILQIEVREDKKRTTLKLSDEDTSQSFRKSIMNEINLSKEAGEKSHTHTQTKDRATESAFHQELFIKTTWVNNPLLSPQTRHISAALSVGKVIWKKTERERVSATEQQREKRMKKRVCCRTPKIPDTHRILCSSSEKSFPGRAAATLGLITHALFRLQTPSSDEKYVSC